jgi:hypothetical protein
MATRKNPLQPLLDQIPAPVQNRYFLVLVFFFAWMVFVDKHDIWTQWKLTSTLQHLKNDKEYYENKIVEVKQDKLDIEKNKEKFAREKYFMKKDDEDVFIILKEGE